MYFPYLRGKQFELLALREIMPVIGGKHVSPVLEPVRQSTTALEKMLEVLIANNINFTLVINPMLGDMADDPRPIVELINKALAEYDNWQIGVLINHGIDLDIISETIDRINVIVPLALIHAQRINDITALATWVRDYEIKYNLYGENFPVRRYRGIVEPNTRILLEDRFRPQAKNADYLNSPDEFFSDDYIFYEGDGFIGFGDYLTIGNDYSESGWAPYAVAIHLTYEKVDEAIWICHFVSDSNEDNNDVPGKFGEAIVKLIEFINENNIQTVGANEFRRLYLEEHYPGLGSIKKLSIMHHLELVHSILARP